MKVVLRKEQLPEEEVEEEEDLEVVSEAAFQEAVVDSVAVEVRANRWKLNWLSRDIDILIFTLGNTHAVLFLCQIYDKSLL